MLPEAIPKQRVGSRTPRSTVKASASRRSSTLTVARTSPSAWSHAFLKRPLNASLAPVKSPRPYSPTTRPTLTRPFQVRLAASASIYKNLINFLLDTLIQKTCFSDNVNKYFPGRPHPYFGLLAAVASAVLVKLNKSTSYTAKLFSLLKYIFLGIL